jgi:hypothetical protein
MSSPVVGTSIECPSCGCNVPQPETDTPVWRARCPECDRRFDVLVHAVSDGPFRDHVGFEAVADAPSPSAALSDVSEGTWLRRVAIAPKNRRYGWASLLALVGTAALAISARSLTHGDIASAVLLLAFAGVGASFAASLAFGREEIGIREGELRWIRRVGPLRRRRTLPVSSVKEIVVGSLPTEGGGYRFFARDPIFLEVRAARVPATTWRVASSVQWAEAELEWLSTHLMDGLERSKSS